MSSESERAHSVRDESGSLLRRTWRLEAARRGVISRPYSGHVPSELMRRLARGRHYILWAARSAAAAAGQLRDRP